MRTIIGLISLLLAAAVVFTAMVFYNSKTEPAYEAKIIKATLANTVKTAKQTPPKKVGGMIAGHKTKNKNL